MQNKTYSSSRKIVFVIKKLAQLSPAKSFHPKVLPKLILHYTEAAGNEWVHHCGHGGFAGEEVIVRGEGAALHWEWGIQE